MTYVNAGHNPPLVIRPHEPASRQIEELMPTGMALGVLDDAGFEQRTVSLDEGDLLILYTDGITDATRQERERFGFDRLRQVAAQARTESATGMLRAIQLAVAACTDVSEQFDDMAIVVARRVAITDEL